MGVENPQKASWEQRFLGSDLGSITPVLPTGGFEEVQTPSKRAPCALFFIYNT